MAWQTIPAFVLNKVFGYQSANALRENIIALSQAPYFVTSKAAPNDFLTNAVLAPGLAQHLSIVIAHFTTPGSGIATGFAGAVMIPWACTITQVTLLSEDPAVTSGSIVVDIWKDTYANYPPTVADTITASAKPTISSGTKGQDSTLTGWTTTLAAGDVLGFNVDSVTSLTRVRVILTVALTL